MSDQVQCPECGAHVDRLEPCPECGDMMCPVCADGDGEHACLDDDGLNPWD